MTFRRRRRNPASAPRRRLHVCTLCGVDAVNPVIAEPLDDFRWCLLMRCGACGARTDAVISNAVAARYDADLDIGWRQISRAIDKIEMAGMRTWADSFITALDRDLIDAADFSLAHDR
jgi:hypothetical protein